MSKASTTSDSDVSLPASDDRFNATASALPTDGSLRGTDRQFVRQFIAAFNDSLLSAYDPIIPEYVARNERGSELRLRLTDTQTTVGYKRVRRAVRNTGYKVKDMRVLSEGTISFAFVHSNE